MKRRGARTVDPANGTARLGDSDDAIRRFHELVWPQRAAVLRIARILTGNDAEADDLAQETLLKAYRRIETFRLGTDIRAWLMTILRNTRIDRARASGQASRQMSLEALEIEPAAPHAGAIESAADDVWRDPRQALNAFSDQQVIDALQRLPEEIRLTLLLIDVEGLDLKDAAEILEVPVGTIKSRAHRGRAMLREALLPIARELRLVRDRSK